MLTGLGVAGALVLALGLWWVFGALRHRSVIGRIRRLVPALVALGVGALTLSLCMALRSFEAFARSTWVAQIQCRWVGHKAFELTYRLVVADRLQAPQVFRLRGDQWTVSGGVVKWHPWLTGLGIPSYHKLSRISGRFAQASEETSTLPTAYDLNGGLDRLWWFFYHVDPYLPFVEAVYGSAAYTYVNPAVVFDVYVMPSGYLIKRSRPGRSQAGGWGEPNQALRL